MGETTRQARKAQGRCGPFSERFISLSGPELREASRKPSGEQHKTEATVENKIGTDRIGGGNFHPGSGCDV